MNKDLNEHGRRESGLQCPYEALKLELIGITVKR